MQTGDTINLAIGRKSIQGNPVVSAASSSFSVAAYQGGALIAPAVTITYVGVSGSLGVYNVAVTLPSTTGVLELFIQCADTSLDFISPGYIAIDLESYDEDAVAALLLLQQGTPAVQSAADSNLGDVVDGDYYKSATLTMPAGKLSPFGITDISTTGITLEAAVMFAPGTTSYPITCTLVNGPGLTFTVSWAGGTGQAWPALTTQQSQTGFLDVQVIQASPKVIVTTNRYTFNQVWQRDTRTA